MPANKWTKTDFVNDVMDALKHQYAEEGAAIGFISNTALICHVLSSLEDYPVSYIITTQAEAKAYLGEVYDGFTKVAVGDLDWMEAQILDFQNEVRGQLHKLVKG
jgi:hypothetical protein